MKCMITYQDGDTEYSLSIRGPARNIKFVETSQLDASTDRYIWIIDFCDQDDIGLPTITSSGVDCWFKTQDEDPLLLIFDEILVNTYNVVLIDGRKYCSSLLARGLEDTYTFIAKGPVKNGKLDVYIKRTDKEWYAWPQRAALRQLFWSIEKSLVLDSGYVLTLTEVIE